MQSRLQKSCRVPLLPSMRRRLSSFLPSSAYTSAFTESMNNKEKFWGDAAKGIDWIKPFSKVYDGSSSPFDKWFPDGELNTCYNCIDRHVERGLGSTPAIIFDSPVSDSREIITYNALLDKVQRLSGVLAGLGVKKGDVVLIYMPMVPEAQVAMLACARLGAVHSVGTWSCSESVE